MNDAVVRGRLLIFAKYPRAGEVKTRLVPPLTFDSAAALYRAFLLDSIDGYATLAPAIEPVVYVANPADLAAMREILAESGHESIDVRPQRGETLGERLEWAFREAFDENFGAVCAIGTDHPTLPLENVAAAFATLAVNDAVIGPATDGGYYLLGMRALEEKIFRKFFRDLPFSTPDLLAATKSVTETSGLRTDLLAEWFDVDDAEGLARLIEESATLPENSRTLRLLPAIVDRFLQNKAEERA